MQLPRIAAELRTNPHTEVDYVQKRTLVRRHAPSAEYFLLADAELHVGQPHIMSGSDAPGHLAVSSGAEHLCRLKRS
jgi:hypothetical protein